MRGLHADVRSNSQLALTTVAIHAPLILPSAASGLATAGTGSFSCCLQWDGSCELVSSVARCALCCVNVVGAFVSSMYFGQQTNLQQGGWCAGILRRPCTLLRTCPVLVA